MKNLSGHQAEKRRNEIQTERIEIEKAKALLVERELVLLKEARALGRKFGFGAN